MYFLISVCIIHELFSSSCLSARTRSGRCHWRHVYFYESSRAFNKKRWDAVTSVSCIKCICWRVDGLVVRLHCCYVSSMGKSVCRHSCCSKSTRQASRIHFISVNSFSDCCRRSNRQQWAHNRQRSWPDREDSSIFASRKLLAATDADGTDQLASMTAVASEKQDDKRWSDLLPIIGRIHTRLPTVITNSNTLLTLLFKSNMLNTVS